MKVHRVPGVREEREGEGKGRMGLGGGDGMRLERWNGEVKGIGMK